MIRKLCPGPAAGDRSFRGTRLHLQANNYIWWWWWCEGSGHVQCRKRFRNQTQVWLRSVLLVASQHSTLGLLLLATARRFILGQHMTCARVLLYAPTATSRAAGQRRLKAGPPDAAAAAAAKMPGPKQRPEWASTRLPRAVVVGSRGIYCTACRYSWQGEVGGWHSMSMQPATWISK